jgi:predicted XRE-type DNA-binding protein
MLEAVPVFEETRQAIRKMVCEQIADANREGMIRYGTERQVTFKQEMAYRLCHQDFFGLGQRDAAEVMEIAQPEVSKLLDRLRKTAPQLFPILEQRMAKMYGLFMEGFTAQEIADEMGIITVHYVRRVLHWLWTQREKTGVYFRSNAGRQVSYSPSMDAHVTEIF